MQAWSYGALPSPISVKHPELGWGSCVLPVPHQHLLGHWEGTWV